jgi:hypothetical protein
MTNLIVVHFVLWIFVPTPWEYEGVEATIGWFPWKAYETKSACEDQVARYIASKNTLAECHKSILTPTIYGTKPNGNGGKFHLKKIGKVL